jgi:hypothetical protein
MKVVLSEQADYKDSMLTAGEYSGHIKALEEINSGEYVSLDELPD